MKIQRVPIADLCMNEGQIEDVPSNPRFIRDEKFEKLKQSIKDHPQMLDLREVIVYDNVFQKVIIAGNMRWKACSELGHKTIPIKLLASNTPKEYLRAIVIKDNVGFGQDDFEMLANEWDLEELDRWGMEIPNIHFADDPEEESTGPVKALITITVPSQLLPKIDKIEDAIAKLVDERYLGCTVKISKV